MIGRTIGNYVIQKKVAEGGMGEVYLAQHPRIGRRVAVKVLHADLGRRADVKARFFTEARAANEIKHEHIIDILDFGEMEDGTPYFIMEWLEGKSLGDELHRVHRMDAARAAHIGVGVAVALRAAHERGIIHRDLKPDNVFLIPRGGDPDFVKVLDFGIAKLSQPGVGPKTETGQILGTPWYMSPEQCRGSAKEIDHRSDLYAMGVMLYEMVTGALPFQAESLGELLLAHMTRDAKPPRELVPGLSPAMEQVIVRAMAKSAADRYQSADELIQDLLPLDTLAAEIAARRTRPQPQATAVNVDTIDSAREMAPTVDAAALTRPKDPESKDPPTVPGDPPFPTVPSPTMPKVTTLGSAAAEAQSAGKGRSRAPIAIAAGLLIALGGIGFAVTRSGNSGPAPAPATIQQPPPATPSIPAAPDPKPAPPPVASVTLSIRTIPAGARLALDDAPLDNPFTGRFPKSDVRRRLTASAPGFVTDNHWLVLDRDRELDIQLAPEPAAKPDKPAPRPVAESKGDSRKPDSRPVYKGTKGKLITTFPE